MRCRRTSRCGATSFWTERPIEQSACRLATCPTAQLLHELADGATHREKLRAIHATYDVADDRSEYPFDSSNAEAGRLLGEKARLGELQRPHEVVFQSGVGEFHDDVGQGIAMRLAVFRFLDGREDRQSLRAKGFRVVEAKEWLG